MDATADFLAMTTNLNLLTKLVKSTDAQVDKIGLVCDFDITGSLFSSVNTLKFYIYLARIGTGNRLCFAQINWIR